MNPIQVALPDGIHPYWPSLLRRIGIPAGRIGHSPCAILFLPDDTGVGDADLRSRVADLREQGAPVLAGIAWGEALGARLRGRDLVGFSQRSIEGIRRIDPSPLLALPFPEASRLLKVSSSFATFTGPNGSAAEEVVARADHGGLRRAVEDALRGLSFAAGRPFARLSPLPYGKDGGLAIRVDADGYRESSTRAVLASLAASGLRATWFVDVERHEANGGMEDVRRIAALGHDVQTHLWRHYTYRSEEQNRRSLARSLEVLARAGIRATAAAAPFGTWNRGFAAALRREGIQWSSEFARVHDDVPSCLGGEPGEPWQVPVHPICPALLLARGHTPDDVAAWWSRVFSRCLARREPAVFYGHPVGGLDRCPGLLPAIARTARGLCRDLWQPTLSELFAFFRARAEQSPRVSMDGNCLIGCCDGPAPLIVELPSSAPLVLRGEFAVVPRGCADLRAPLRPAVYEPLRRGNARWRAARLRARRMLAEIRR
ncbi:MAG: hypothetical protein Fur0037_26420 [Planctomycetota bacterium]